MVISAAFLDVFEKSSQPYNTILDYLYFMVITLSVVGYGDVLATTVPGRVTNL